MALAKKCSRCGKYYDHYPTGKKTEYNALRRVMTTYTGQAQADGKVLELCEDCMSEFDRWMISGGKFDEQP